MLCCSYSCEKYLTCARAASNNPGKMEVLEPLDCYGWGSYSYNVKTKEVIQQSETMCQNYSLYWPAYHQITMDEILEGQYE